MFLFFSIFHILKCGIFLLCAERKTDQTDLEKEIRNLLSVPEKPDGIDGFLMRLGESLRKLPYRERSKLEIDIMKMVYDTECRLNIN